MPDGDPIWVQIDGLAALRDADRVRVSVASVKLRSGAGHYQWMNHVFAVLEGVLDTSTGVARGELHECRVARP